MNDAALEVVKSMGAKQSIKTLTKDIEKHTTLLCPIKCLFQYTQCIYIKSYLVQMVHTALVNNSTARNHSPKIFAALRGIASQTLLICKNVICLVFCRGVQSFTIYYEAHIVFKLLGNFGALKLGMNGETVTLLFVF